MVTGTLRGVLWVLSTLAVVWLVSGLFMLPAMGRMMGEGGMMGGGMMNGGMRGGMGSMMGMMVTMGAQFLAMLGLVGVFVYLVVDSFRKRSSAG
jgi:hypothetical protein